MEARVCSPGGAALLTRSSRAASAVRVPAITVRRSPLLPAGRLTRWVPRYKSVDVEPSGEASSGEVETRSTMYDTIAEFQAVSARAQESQLEGIGADPEVLAGWLEEEPEDVKVAVDWGEWGRPINASYIKSHWQNMAGVCRGQGLQLVWHKTFALRTADTEELVGHAEVTTARVMDPGATAMNAWLGQDQPFALLGEVYVPRDARSQGFGHMLVSKVCAHIAKTTPVCRVVTLVPLDNDQAMRFFHSMGFTDTEVEINKDGQNFTVLLQTVCPGAPMAELF